MRVFDFDGTIYDGESLFDLYLFSAKYNPKVLRYIAPVLRYAIKYKLGRATFDQMEYGVGKLCHGYLSELAESLEFEELVNAFWDQNMKRIKPWYEPREDDVILTASFDITVGEACRRLGVQHLVSSTIDGNTLNVNSSTSTPTSPNDSANSTATTHAWTNSTRTAIRFYNPKPCNEVSNLQVQNFEKRKFRTCKPETSHHHSTTTAKHASHTTNKSTKQQASST